jgi:serine/threonine-protein kinase
MVDYVLDDRYALIERIATGGMGEVWRGNDALLGRTVAIKMLAAMHADDAQFRARFRAEARFASSLAHPGITRVYDYGEHSPLGGPYLVMELVDGQPLSEIIDRNGRLEPYVVMDIVAQAGRALDTAHRAGIVHRDIKPGNLLIMADGTTKITDFGIAKANVQDLSLTATGIVMGTALYVSPEQATGQPLSGSSDVYSLGVVAYECLAGHPPFVADQPLAIAIMHKHDPVPPLPNDVPRPIAKLIYSMLAKDPKDRPESARHVSDRAEVIREARFRSGYAGPATADLPVVPNFPPATSMDLYQGASERLPDPRDHGSRNFLIAGIGAAGIGVVAIIAVLISSNSSTSLNLGGNTTMPTQSQSALASHKAVAGKGVTQPAGSTAGVDPGSGLVVVGATGSPISSKSPAASKSPTPTPTPTPTKSTKPTAPPTTTPPTTTPPTTRRPTTPPPTTAPPTTQPPTTAPPTTEAPTTAPPTTTTTTAATTTT